jgi:hypothetical protein
MNEIEEKFKKFNLDGNMREMFSHSSVEIDGMHSKAESFVITTVVIDRARKSKEDNDAKLV